MTIMSTRDGARLPSGLVGPSVCEVEKTGLDPETNHSHMKGAASDCLGQWPNELRPRLLVASLVFLVAAIGAVAVLLEA